MEQLHKRFTTEQVKDLMRRYANKELNRNHIQQVLQIGKRQFFSLLKEYRMDPENFSIQYSRTSKTRTIDAHIEKNILKQLKETKSLIDNKEMPVRSYNYSFIKKDIETSHNQKVSLSTIIGRAKKYGFYIERSKKRKVHSREVITNNVGELVQHDASLHLWSPWALDKWTLITSIDDYSRLILYAILVAHESAWAHIRALQTIFLKYGLPLRFYVDNHSIFRFVRGRDELHYKHHLMTDEAIPQWKHIMNDCHVQVIHALSPQAKGKVERPYGWIQDHVVRTCARDKISEIIPANQVLFREVYHYNHRWIHSTTGEVPIIRYQRAIKEKKTLFRPFIIPPPYQSVKDIFCYRMNRVVDSYRSISIKNVQIKFNNAPIHQTVDLRIHPDQKTGLSEIRFWYKDRLLDVKQIQTELILPVQF